MEYNLAVELKKAGFPESKISITKVFNEKNLSDEPIYAPTLSELIEACDLRSYDHFRIMYKPYKELGKEWQCCVFTTKRHHIVHYGYTIEEAVARLWLSLNHG